MNSLIFSVGRGAIVLLGLPAPFVLALEPPVRALSADRPDSTESPLTVPRGMWQIESSFFSLTKDDTGGTDFESWVLGETNVKFGTTSQSDLQLVLQPYVHERERTAMGLAEAHGIGDVEVRFKWNLWGNDGGGATAGGLLPYVKIPTGTDVSNHEWEGGLIVPVIRKTDEMKLLDIARATSDLGERARTKKLLPDEIQGGTFTITNPGNFGGLFGIPIIHQPQVAILAMGGIESRPVVVDEAIAVRPMVYLALSFDHRIIDGAVADGFMADIKHTLENWKS